jgi:sensor histidine kinase regulating citrate/malate metabolism
MATALMANETEIKQAMGVLGLGNLTDNLLDEIELDRRLKISLEQADKGLGRPIEDFKKELEQKFASGYFSKENTRKRIEERRWKMKN